MIGINSVFIRPFFSAIIVAMDCLMQPWRKLHIWVPFECMYKMYLYFSKYARKNSQKGQRALGMVAGFIFDLGFKLETHKYLHSPCNAHNPCIIFHPIKTWKGLWLSLARTVLRQYMQNCHMQRMQFTEMGLFCQVTFVSQQLKWFLLPLRDIS